MTHFLELKANLIPPFQGYQTKGRYSPGAALLRRLPLAIIFRALGAEFLTKYSPQSTADSFVDALLAKARAAGSELDAVRDNLIANYQTGVSLAQSRAAVLLALADNATIRQANYNSAFVLTEYFGYLQRDPEPAGFDYWLNALNNKTSWQLSRNGVRVYYVRGVSETIQLGHHALERGMWPLT